MPRAFRLAADEIGLAYGRLGDFVLRSEVQPVFRRHGAWLRAEAAAIRTSAHLRRQPVDWNDFLAGLTAAEQLEVDDGCRELDLCNHAHISDEPIELFPGPVHDRAPNLPAWRVPANPFGDQGPVCFPLSAGASRADGELYARARLIRANGMRLCLTDIASRAAIDACLDAIDPDVVHIDAPWFARLAEGALLRRLLAQLIGRLHRCGAEVLVERIDDTSRLSAAIEAGADLLAGNALAPFAAVGRVFEPAPLEIAELLARQGNVIPVAFLRQNFAHRHE